MLKWLLMLGAGYVIYRGARITKSLVKSEILFENLRFQKIQNARIYFLVNIKIDNTQNNAFTFNEIVCDVIYKGTKAGRILRTYNNLKVEARKITNIKDVSFYLEGSSIVTEALTLLKGGKLANIQIKGYLQGDGIKFPIDETIEM